jgi:hypothetical protein
MWGWLEPSRPFLNGTEIYCGRARANGIKLSLLAAATGATDGSLSVSKFSPFQHLRSRRGNSARMVASLDRKCLEQKLSRRSEDRLSDCGIRFRRSGAARQTPGALTKELNLDSVGIGDKRAKVRVAEAHTSTLQVPLHCRCLKSLDAGAEVIDAIAPAARARVA